MNIPKYAKDWFREDEWIKYKLKVKIKFVQIYLYAQSRRQHVNIKVNKEKLTINMAVPRRTL